MAAGSVERKRNDVLMEQLSPEEAGANRAGETITGTAEDTATVGTAVMAAAIRTAVMTVAIRTDSIITKAKWPQALPSWGRFLRSVNEDLSPFLNA